MSDLGHDEMENDHEDESHIGIEITNVRTLADFNAIDEDGEPSEKRKKECVGLFDWNQCRYHCSTCSMDFQSHAASQSHQKSEHLDLPCTATKQLSHSCLICQQLIRFELGEVCAHLEDFHQVPLGWYEKKYQSKLLATFEELGIGEKTPNLEPPLKGQGSKEVASNPDECSSSPKVKPEDESHGNEEVFEEGDPSLEEKNYDPDKKDVNADSVSADEEEIKNCEKLPPSPKKRAESLFNWNQCTFKCRSCTRTFYSSSSFWRHANEENHNLKYLLKGGGVYHICLACGVEVKCAKVFINHHLTSKHGVTLDQYESKYHDELQKIFKEKKFEAKKQNLDKGCEGEQEMKKQVKKPPPGNPSQPYVKVKVPPTKDVHRSAPEAQRNKRNYASRNLILNLPKSVTVEITKRETTKKKVDSGSINQGKRDNRCHSFNFEWNQCIYQCKSCRRKCYNFNTATYHVKTHEPTSKIVTLKLAKHECLLCGKRVRCDLNWIRAHLARSSNHNMTVTEYENMFHDQLEEKFSRLNSQKTNNADSSEDETVVVKPEISFYQDTERMSREGPGTISGAKLETGFGGRFGLNGQQHSAKNFKYENVQRRPRPLEVTQTKKCLQKNVKWIVKTETESSWDHNEEAQQTILTDLTFVDGGRSVETVEDNYHGNMDVLCSEQMKADELSSKMNPRKSYSRRHSLRFNWNRCIYKCHACQELRHSLNAINSHSKSHEPASETALLKLENHKCLICGKMVRCDINWIRSHMARSTDHKITVNEYERMFYNQLRETLTEEPEDSYQLRETTTEEPKDSRQLREILVEEPEDPHQNSPDIIYVDDDFANVPKSSFNARCEDEDNNLLSLSIVEQDFHPIKPPSEVKPRHKYKFDWNQCTYECSTCKKIYNNFNAIVAHKKTHKPVSEIIVLKLKNHRCLICQREVRFDPSWIRTHFARPDHQITLIEYERRFHDQLQEVFSITEDEEDPLAI